MDKSDLHRRTIEDFGAQWTRYRDNEGYYGSAALFADFISPLLQPENFKGKRVAEIGAGSGRIVLMMAEAGAAEIVALEPSDAIQSLRRNTASIADKLTYIQALGEELPDLEFDLVVSIGVVMCIPEPDPVLKAAYRALKPGGQFFMWVYAWEGNEAYLALALPLRRITTRLPAPLLAAVCWGLVGPLSLYIQLCRWCKHLPLAEYLCNVLGKLSWKYRQLIIFDQLNPTYCEYYTREKAEGLVRAAGFVDVRSHFRHGYSWAVLGCRPESDERVAEK